MFCYCFWSFLGFLLFFVLFCFQINLFLAFSWLYTIFVWFYAFSLIVFGPGTLGQAGQAKRGLATPSFKFSRAALAQPGNLSSQS